MSASREIPALRPTVDELLEGVQEHLTAALIPTLTDPKLRYQTLVAAHVLGVVRRELMGGSAARRELADARAALPGAPTSDAELCSAIERGDFDDPAANEALRAHLRQRVESMLMAWNPMFLMRVRGG